MEEETHDDGENGQRDDFLNNLQLHEGEGAAVTLETNTVGRDGKAVLNEGDAPREGDDTDEGPVVADACLLKTQMAVPGKCHEYVAGQEKKYSL